MDKSYPKWIKVIISKWTSLLSSWLNFYPLGSHGQVGIECPHQIDTNRRRLGYKLLTKSPTCKNITIFGHRTFQPEMSATEAQLGLASEFEFEFDHKFDNRVRVRVRVSSSTFWVIVSGFECRVPFPGSIFGSFPGPFRDSFSLPFGIPEKTRKRPLWAAG